MLLHTLTTLALALSLPPALTGEIHHEVAARLDPDAHRVEVVDVLTLPEELRGAPLEFTLNRALDVTASEPAIERLGDEGELARRYRLNPVPADGGLTLHYAGAIQNELSDATEEYSRGMRHTSGIVGEEGVYLDGGSLWIPRVGDRMIRFRVTVEQPDGWHVISQGNGHSRGADGRAVWESGGALEQIYLVGGPLVVERESAGSVEALVYLHEPDEALSRKYLDATARYIEMYRRLIGPYPYEKFALVENFWETGYGMPSFTLLGEQVIRLPFILHSSYPHEILHNWWGNSVFVASETGNWCEGLTAYMADHLIQEQRGRGAEYRRSTLQKYRDYVREGRDFPLRQFTSRHSAATEAVGYGKALMVFHMLRQRFGDDVFSGALRDFYRSQRGKRASWDDLRTAFERASEVELGDWFAQWLERPGAPRVELGQVQVVERDGQIDVAVTIEQTQRDEPWSLRVPVAIAYEGGVQHLVAEFDGREGLVRTELPAPPTSIAVDPGFDLFRLLDPRETPASIGQLFGESHVLAVLPRENPEPYRELMEGWRTEQLEIELVDEDALAGLPAGKSVWLLGDSSRFAMELAMSAPEEARIESADSLTLAGETVARADHSTVVVWRHPGHREKAIGWIRVAPDAAFPGMARKLPHYGKYSYLAFEGDEPTNTVKGQWLTTDSPLVRVLDPGSSEPLPGPEADAALAELPPVFSESAMMADVRWLADPAREGRGLGSAGLDRSAEYIAARMEAAGLRPGGANGGWFQEFTVAEGPDGRPVRARNVLGLLPGSRGDWSDQSVVLSAHYDHLGRGWPDAHKGEEGQLHLGADDNASGVAVLLALAKNLASEGGGSRSLVFAAFSAEECGLVGSRAYVQNPRLPLSGLRGVVNLDTVGRLGDGKIAIHGTGTTDEWQHIFRGCGFVTGIDSVNVPAGAEGSDQWSFIEAGIPGVQIFTGAHGDYHRVGDTVDKVDAAGLVKVATFVKEAVGYLLEREEPMTNRIEGATGAQPATASAQSGRKVSFGSVPDFAFGGPGVRVSSVVPGSPAEQAGVQADDVLLVLGGETIESLRGFSQLLAKHEAGETVKVELERGGERLTLDVTLVAR